MQGKLYATQRSSDTLLFVTAGFTGRIGDYEDYFSRLLGEEHLVYFTELRNKGFARTQTHVKDVTATLQRVQDYLRPERTILLGHSLGSLITARLDGNFFYAMTPHPSVAAMYKDSLLHVPAQIVTETTIGPCTTFPETLEKKTRVALCEEDIITRTKRPAIRDSFTHYFQQKGADVVLFAGKNHCFNHDLTLTPFNKDTPYDLIDDVLRFVNS